MQALGNGDNGSDFAIRRALPADADAIAVVHVAAWRETYAGIMGAETLAGLSVERRALNWYRRLTEAGSDLAVFIAERGGALVGFAASGKGRDPDVPANGEIHGIYLLRAHQRSGIGRALMRAAAAYLRAAGYRSAYLWALEENRAAAAFYTRLGATVVAERLEEIAGETHRELAYLWPDISLLLDGNDARPRS